MRADATAHFDLSIEQNWALVVWLCDRETHDLDGARRKLKPQLAPGIFENGPDLDELRDQCAQAAVGGQSLEGEWHRHPRARAHARHRVVLDMEIRVWIVARRGEEPRLHGPSISHAFDAACSLSQPYVAKATTEQAALAALLGQLAERAEPAVDRHGIDANAVVCATNLEVPGAQRRDS